MLEREKNSGGSLNQQTRMVVNAAVTTFLTMFHFHVTVITSALFTAVATTVTKCVTD